MKNRIDIKLQSLKEAGKTALAPFVTIGFPDIPMSEALAEVVLSSGADMLELGIPFSDPLAEGPTIQMTSFKALQNGVNIPVALDVARRLRQKKPDAPLIFMGYYNPYLHYGIERFIGDAADAGVDGFIVPDLPTEESSEFREICESHGIYLIPLLAPTSSDQRIAEACKGARGFIYCVSLTGVTGARGSMSSSLPDFVSRIRRYTDVPVMVGFGVSQREHVEAIGQFANGAIVGSALLDAIDKAASGQELQIATDFVKRLSGQGSTD